MSSQLLVARALLRGPVDSKMLPMIVDTGATTTIIPREIAVAIGCDPAKTEQRAMIITACHTIPSRLQTEGLLGIDFLKHLPAFQDFQAAIQRLSQF